MKLLCPLCNEETQIEAVEYFAPWGYTVTFVDFMLLFTYPAYFRVIQPLVRSFGYKVKQQDPLLFRDKKGLLLSPETVHRRIQYNTKQRMLMYGFAMSCWHGFVE
mgnify:FL=1